MPKAFAIRGRRARRLAVKPRTNDGVLVRVAEGSQRVGVVERLGAGAGLLGHERGDALRLARALVLCRLFALAEDLAAVGDAKRRKDGEVIRAYMSFIVGSVIVAQMLCLIFSLSSSVASSILSLFRLILAGPHKDADRHTHTHGQRTTYTDPHIDPKTHGPTYKDKPTH